MSSKFFNNPQQSKIDKGVKKPTTRPAEVNKIFISNEY